MQRQTAAPAGARHAVPARHRARPEPDADFPRALMLTTLGAVLPGVTFLAAGRRWLGSLIAACALVVVAGGVWLGSSGKRVALHAAVNPGILLKIGIGVLVLALLWIIVVATGYRLVRPRYLTGGQRVTGMLVVCLLCLAGGTPALAGARYAFVQRDLISSVFASDTKSATVPKVVNKADPWRTQPRVNLLLLGSDAGAGRIGARTDSIVVASIDTKTGNTLLFSLPRSLERLPFPPGPLRDAYPNGFRAPGNEGEQLLNAVYGTVPAMHPHILGATDNLGADVLKLGVGEALGLRLDYYLMINLEGFAQLVNSLGGVTVNINEWVAIGGATDGHHLPEDYLRPGQDVHLGGVNALWFARGRFGTTDYARMKRQRCVIKAIIDTADPVKVLTRYQQLAKATKSLVRTDIPQPLLDAFVELSMRIKGGTTRSVVFDNTVINAADPDYDLIRRKVREGFASLVTPVRSSPSSTPSTTASPVPSTSPRPARKIPGQAEALTTSCAYDPVAAQKALSQGKPPTKRTR
ncbi:MAG: LCP family protein [Actinomycetota bacterium]|nr:LCP family protein [Actinomycetota bacterium]